MRPYERPTELGCLYKTGSGVGKQGSTVTAGRGNAVVTSHNCCRWIDYYYRPVIHQKRRSFLERNKERGINRKERLNCIVHAVDYALGKIHFPKGLIPLILDLIL